MRQHKGASRSFRAISKRLGPRDQNPETLRRAWLIIALSHSLIRPISRPTPSESQSARRLRTGSSHRPGFPSSAWALSLFKSGNTSATWALPSPKRVIPPPLAIFPRPRRTIAHLPVLTRPRATIAFFGSVLPKMGNCRSPAPVTAPSEAARPPREPIVGPRGGKSGPTPHKIPTLLIACQRANI